MMVMMMASTCVQCFEMHRIQTSTCTTAVLLSRSWYLQIVVLYNPDFSANFMDMVLLCRFEAYCSKIFEWL
jgi:hypothetical protein